MQIEGVATILGHSLNKENAWFKKYLSLNHLEDFESYSHLKEELELFLQMLLWPSE